MIDRENIPWGAVEAYVRGIANRMGLGLYWISVERSAPGAIKEKGMVVNAEVTMHPNSLAFSIYFGDSFFSNSAEFQRHVITHELLHVHEKPSDALIDILCDRGEIPAKAWDMWVDGYNQARERFIDTMAALLAPQFPLPNFTADGL
jgi:hypothetical protein